MGACLIFSHFEGTYLSNTTFLYKQFLFFCDYVWRIKVRIPPVYGTLCHKHLIEPLHFFQKIGLSLKEKLKRLSFISQLMLNKDAPPTPMKQKSLW